MSQKFLILVLSFFFSKSVMAGQLNEKILCHRALGGTLSAERAQEYDLLIATVKKYEIIKQIFPQSLSREFPVPEINNKLETALLKFANEIVENRKVSADQLPVMVRIVAFNNSLERALKNYDFPDIPEYDHE